mgnify:CR=1 FL=1
MTTSALQEPSASGTLADRLVRLPEVRFLTGLGKSSIYDAVKAGTFPQAVRVTDYAVAWRKSEIDAWIASRPTASAPPPPVASPATAPKPAGIPRGRTVHRSTPAPAKHGRPAARKARA